MTFPSFDDVALAATAIISAKITPTVRNVAEHLGGTKNHTIIAQHLRAWHRDTLVRLTSMEEGSLDIEPHLEDPSREISISEAVIRLPGHPPYASIYLKGISGHVEVSELKRISLGVKDSLDSALYAAPAEKGGGIVATFAFYQMVKTRLTADQAKFLTDRAALIVMREEQLPKK